MTKTEYQMAQERLMLLANFAVDAGFDVDAFVECIERSEAVSCFFVAPADYQRGAPRLEKIKAMALALKRFQDASKEFRALLQEQEA